MLNSDARPEPAGQSRLMSLVEAITNVAIGYALAVVTQVLIFPLFGLHTTLEQNLKMGAVFTGVSLLRSYVLRRLFEGQCRHRQKYGGPT